MYTTEWEYRAELWSGQVVEGIATVHSEKQNISKKRAKISVQLEVEEFYDEDVKSIAVEKHYAGVKGN